DTRPAGTSHLKTSNQRTRSLFTTPCVRACSAFCSKKECFTEQIQILEGKISVLEDELEKLRSNPRER
ncbi:hypothetical protein AMELA_G00037630, partial [Ameiurus melas]